MQSKKHTKKKRTPKKGCVTERCLRRVVEIRAAKERKELKEIERLNNTRLGHPDHGDRVMIAFNPLLNWMKSVEETCEMELTTSGAAILHAPDHPSSEKWFQLDSACIAIADTYELIAIDRGIEDKSDGLRKLGNKVAIGMMLFESDFDLARESIYWMAEVAKEMSPFQITEYTSIVATRALLQQQNSSQING